MSKKVKKEQGSKQTRRIIKKKVTPKEYAIYALIALALIFLTSSFVMESVYTQAGRIRVTPQGVREIYEVCIGTRETLDSEDVTVQETLDEEEDTKASEPTPSAKTTPSATPSTANPSPTTTN